MKLSNDKNSKLLIIIPMYNACAFIRDTIVSILNQQVNVKLIIVDDCSTDSSYEIASSFKDTIMLRNSVNRGTYYSINNGLNYMSDDSTWTHYAIHGADDISSNDRFIKQLSVLNESSNNILATGCGFKRVDYRTKKTMSTNTKTNESMLVMKREIFDAIGYFDSFRAGCDTEYKRRIQLAKPGCIESLNEILLTAYSHDSNLTKKIPLGGTFRKNYVASFTREHQEMKSKNNFYKDFTP